MILSIDVNKIKTFFENEIRIAYQNPKDKEYYRDLISQQAYTRHLSNTSK